MILFSMASRPLCFELKNFRGALFKIVVFLVESTCMCMSM